VRIAYLTTDEVNESTACRMAAACGVTLHPLLPRDAPPNGQFDAVLYDLDSLPPGGRQEVVSELVSNLPSCPVAVHSYNLEDDVVHALHEKHVIVFRRLGHDLLSLLRRAVASAHGQ
jgi:hypothetical protein